MVEGRVYVFKYVFFGRGYVFVRRDSLLATLSIRPSSRQFGIYLRPVILNTSPAGLPLKSIVKSHSRLAILDTGGCHVVIQDFQPFLDTRRRNRYSGLSTISLSPWRLLPQQVYSLLLSLPNCYGRLNGFLNIILLCHRALRRALQPNATPPSRRTE